MCERHEAQSQQEFSSGIDAGQAFRGLKQTLVSLVKRRINLVTELIGGPGLDSDELFEATGAQDCKDGFDPTTVGASLVNPNMVRDGLETTRQLLLDFQVLIHRFSLN